MNNRALLLSLVILSAPLQSHANEKEREHAYDVLHYAINIRVDEVSRSVEGSVSVRLVPLKSLDLIELDAAEMDILRVDLLKDPAEAVPLDFLMTGDHLMVRTPEPVTGADTITLSISYRCTPRNGLFFRAPDEAYPDRPWQVWSQGEMEDNHYWLPCYDYPNDRATVEMHVTVKEKFMAISNGELVEVTHNIAEKTRTYHWSSSQPFVSYLISLVVGEYAEIEERYKEIPVQYFVYPHQKDDAMRSFARTPAMISFFSSKVGFEYPWPKYAQTVVAEFNYGGMENASATTLTDKTIHSARAHLDLSSEPLVAHELAHQWFGDLVTCRSWSHAWLNEGFATYFSSIWAGHEKGWDDFQLRMLAEQQAVIKADTGIDRRPTVTDRYSNPAEVFDSRIYARGACILNMLHFVMGDTLFWKGIRQYVKENQYGLVQTSDFQHSMEEVSGTDLRWFFEEWTVKAGFPAFELVHRYDADTRRLVLIVRQTQWVDELTPLYRMPVDVEVDAAGGATIHRVMLEAQPEQTFSFEIGGPPLNIVFDKGNWILKTLQYRKTANEWMRQLEGGDIVGRIEALKGLESTIDDPEVRSAVVNTLEHDPFWGVREQAARSLGVSSDPDLITAFAAAFRDTVARVRIAATASLKSLKTLDALIALGNILSTDSSYAVGAEAITSLVAIDSTNGLAYVERGLALDSPNDVIRAAAVKALGRLKSGSVKDRLMTLTGYGQSLEVRQAAIEALGRNWKDDDEVRLQLQRLMFDPIQRVQRKAIEELGIMASAKSRAQLTDFIKLCVDAILKREAKRAVTMIDRAVMTDWPKNSQE